MTITKTFTNLSALTERALVNQLQFKDKDLATSIHNTAKINQWQFVDQFHSLTCHKADLYWLDGIEQLQALTRLELKSDILDRFEPLAHLLNLTHLTIEAFRFNDFSVLANMSKLTHLAIRSHVGISPTDIHQLLPSLKYVDIA